MTADAVTVETASNSAYGITLQLRYSPACQTVWARMYGGRSGDEYTFGVIVPSTGNFLTNNKNTLLLARARAGTCPGTWLAPFRRRRAPGGT